jgi:hypothetical protein
MKVKWWNGEAKWVLFILKERILQEGKFGRAQICDIPWKREWGRAQAMEEK